MNNTIPYVEKEISWLSFNARVLQEADDPSVPLIERVRFLGIFSSNLDEFFRVHVAEVRRRMLFNQEQELNEEYDEASILLEKINDKVVSLTRKFSIVSKKVFIALKKRHIHLLRYQDKLTSFQNGWLHSYFQRRVIRHITPILITKRIDLLRNLQDESAYFLMGIKKGDEVRYVLIEIPHTLERFIALPPEYSKKEKYIVMLDDVIDRFKEDIFVGLYEFDEIEAYSIKLTRDAEFDLGDDFDQSKLDQMSRVLKQRIKAEPVRLVYDGSMPSTMVKFLRKRLKFTQADTLVPGVRYRNFKDFIHFPNPGRTTLEFPEFEALDSEPFIYHRTVFDAISENDILLYYPYHKFRNLTEFIRQASYDPAVTSIYLNIYRVAKNSLIIKSLMEAVKNSKEVIVVIELRARFDEEANLEWAKIMKNAGITVEVGIPSLKIHSKLCLVTRIEQNQLVRYAHVGTGNFHEETARRYTDFALFTKHPGISKEVENVFSFIEHSYKRFTFEHLLLSPLSLRHNLYQLIEHEIKNAKLGRTASITFKVNNLVDKELVTYLYRASQAGVKIRGIVRGMCSLVPGISGFSDRIQIISIVDMFLEHPRVMVFHHSGESKIYISSADWMTRNLDQRVEVACPIYDEALKKRILSILALHFKDTTKARYIDSELSNQYVPRGNKRKIRSQLAVYDYLTDEERLMYLKRSRQFK